MDDGGILSLQVCDSEDDNYFFIKVKIQAEELKKMIWIIFLTLILQQKYKKMVQD